VRKSESGEGRGEGFSKNGGRTNWRVENFITSSFIYNVCFPLIIRVIKLGTKRLVGICSMHGKPKTMHGNYLVRKPEG
jgi:hypothetical protein